MSNHKGGITLLQILIGVSVGVMAPGASINAIQVQRADAEQARTVQFVTSELPKMLTQLYFSSGRTYGDGATTGLYALGEPGDLSVGSSTKSDTIAAALAKSMGLPATLPSGDVWALQEGADDAQVVLLLGCSQGSGRAAERCSALAEAIRSKGSRMIADPASDVGFDTHSAGAEFVSVTLSRPA